LSHISPEKSIAFPEKFLGPTLPLFPGSNFPFGMNTRVSFGKAKGMAQPSLLLCIS
jgi:hypothetical protein